MFRVIDSDASGTVRTATGSDAVHLPPEGTVRWIDLSAQDADQMELLAGRFGFHPLAVEDCLHFDQRSKLESYQDCLFLVVHGFAIESITEALGGSLELHMFLGRGYLVTVHERELPGLETVFQRVQREGSILRKGPDFLCYTLCDAVVDGYFPILDDLATQVDDLEDRVLDAGHSVDLARIFAFKRLLLGLRKVLSPQRDVLALLAKRGEGWIGEHTAVYFRDVYDHILRLHESVDATRDLLGNVLDAWLWSASQRTNEIMKRLTLLSAIFLPLTFITGFFGQNFEGLPYGNTWLLVLMFASCLAVPALMLYFFMRSKWF